MKLNRRTGHTSFALLAHIGALITVGAWSTSFLSTKVLMDDGGFTPVEMYVYRFTVAYILLLMFTFKKIFSNSWKDEITLALCGICAGSLYFITENYALTLTSTGNVSLLASISPILTTFLLAIVFGQRIRSAVYIGSAIAFVGVGCIIFSHGEGMEFHPQGDILAIAAALCWSIYTIAIKRIIPLYTGLFITRKLFFYGVVTAIPLLLIQQEPYHFLELFNFQTPQYFWNFAFLVGMCSLTAYLLWNEVMKYLGAVTANNYLYLQPLLTMIAAYFILDEKIYPLGYLGCLLIVGGLIISDKIK